MATLYGSYPTVSPACYGEYRITGTAQVQGAAAQRRILLLERTSGKALRETRSDASTGAFAFNYLANWPKGYLLIEQDWREGASPFNAAIADLVTPEPMP